MSHWFVKYRPTKLEDVDFNRPQAELLKKIVSYENFPHLFIYGPSGSGKSTRVNALLCNLFGNGVKKMKIENKCIETPSGKKIFQSFLSSNYHIQVNPSENGFHDRVVVQELIKEVATSVSLSKAHSFKVIVISHADQLTQEAQQSLRRTLEKYITTCRVILVGERSSKIIPALKSRCLLVPNGAPTIEEIVTILENIANCEDVKSNDIKVLTQIATNSDRNLRRAIWMFQSYNANLNKSNQKSLLASTNCRWLDQIHELAKKLVESQSVKKMPEIRAMLYELQIHLIPPGVILKNLLKKLLEHSLDNQMKAALVESAAECDHRIALGNKAVIHLELFVVKFMTIYRCSIEKVVFDSDDSMDLD